MDSFGKDHTSSTSIEPNSPFQGNYVKKLSEEMDFKLKSAHEKRLAIEHFMATTTSSASKTCVPKRGKLADRNNSQTLDVEERHCLPRSYSFDSKDSIMAVDPHDDIKNNLLQPYDPINNYLSPRPRYLKYNPDRHREIFDRQENVNRVRRSASYDSGMRFPKEEFDCSLGASSREETDIITPEHEHEEEEKEEVFDDFEEGSGWNSKVFVQYLIVIIVLILTTFTITSMNSPNLSPAREAVRGFMNLYTKTYSGTFTTVDFEFSEVGKLSKREIDYNRDEIGTKDVGDDNMDYSQLEEYEIEEVQNCKIDDEIWSKNDTGQFQDSDANEIQEKEEISPVILKSEEIYSDFDRGEVSEELEILEMMVDEDGGKEDGMDENILMKLARFDPLFAAFIGVCILILPTLGIIYYSNKSKATIAHNNSTNNTKYLESFVNSSPFTYKTTHSGSDASSSSQPKSSYLEFSTDSPSYGSFTVEKKIVKKKKNTKPEVMLSPVRRSSRIQNRSITSP